MSKIERVEVRLINLIPPVKRTDAIQAFISQETPIIRIYDDQGAIGTGYCYTIGVGGHAVVDILQRHLCPQLIGRDPVYIEEIWHDLLFYSHATSVGPIMSLSLAAIDIALWDLRCINAGEPLHVLAGGAQHDLTLYTTEGGWLHIETKDLVTDALRAKAEGFSGSKVKVGRPHISEDIERLRAVREAVGPAYEIMVDANQAFQPDEAIRRAAQYESLDLAWFEEPMPADDLTGHIRLSSSTCLPIAVGESLYSLGQFREYMTMNACSVVQPDVARVGGITPWLKIAHMAEGFNLPICPHFLMEIHVSLVAAVPNGRWIEYIPQLESITQSGIRIKDGRAFPSSKPGLGIEWDWDKITHMQNSQNNPVFNVK